MKFSIELSIMLICISSNKKRMATPNSILHRVRMCTDEKGGFIARSISLIIEIKNLVYNKRQTVDSS